ncbi:metal-dependent hydrolase [Limibaculum sp. FT325]|uniref:metal-dependent hydrolase n=1 Tax=Thermohalobaculum sediminis TaxID=2939436 RepID=UPI0020BF426D|nr:metal-dependent hydrolase [Limibaculum sediminis]MCL5777132.1 metal-dependent hydrolase [Limibaculum sediminis]
MKVTWLGHASFRIETAGKVLLLDPWLRGNPAFDESRLNEAVAGATHILVTHGHGDHAADAPEIARKTGATLVGIYDWVSWITAAGDVEGIGMNKGGTVDLGGVRVTMVNAVHSASATGPDGAPVYTGTESGFMVESGAVTLYVMGDTDVMADMGVFQDLHAPTHAIVPIGGHFTMDATRAAYACRKFFDFKGVIVSHYRTFPLLAQSADEFRAKVAPLTVHAPEVMESVTL